ncbi:carboxypeptidase-like regulatory domain-containing protein [Aliifodinibius salicampi]|uniref:Carboxypeptidase-like regulatory domain-containing protein n=1 Tax=Fodinibius salicampi TaxID=1920655 RepID=A0ABT3PYG8_9BACT|nr:carboxypeptidase-like regulatory domain-containing protein [Fodinibius salicampi]MCW9712887.1 carboxypeptidase-like regulatory domain-containing protein [Fodinibius salicampi]
MSIKYFLTFITCIIIFVGCSKETISPELFGSIEGQIFNSETEEGIRGVNVTTNPATNSITTNEDGTFVLNEVPTGQYSVSAQKSDFESSSVSVRVRENKAATAQIYLDPEGGNGEKYLSARVTTWAETSNNDSTFAEVQYEVENTSDDTDINQYEVYFDIHTSGETFSWEERDTTLAAGEKDIAEFKKYVRQATIDSVTVSGTFTSN